MPVTKNTRTTQGKAPRTANRVSLPSGGKAAVIASGGKAGLGGKSLPAVQSSYSKVVKKPRRYRPGTISLREIKRYQKDTNLLLAKAPFRRLVKEIIMDLPNKKSGELGGGFEFAGQIRLTKNAVLALQHISEQVLVEMFEDAQIHALHAGRIGISKKDMQLAKYHERKATERARNHAHS